MRSSSCFYLILYNSINVCSELLFGRFRSFAASASFAPGALLPAPKLCTTLGKRFRWPKGSGATSFARRYLNTTVLHVFMMFNGDCALLPDDIWAPAQNPAAHPRGVIFFSRKFAVDPGDGRHISYKINHSAQQANLRVVAERADASGDDIFVFRAARVRCHCAEFFRSCSLRAVVCHHLCLCSTDFLSRFTGHCSW